MTKLEELKAALETATHGEWVTGKGGTAYYPLQIRCVSGDWDSLIAAFHSWDAQKESNAEFIALAHNLMPTLLEAVEKLEYLNSLCSDYNEEYWATSVCREVHALLEELE